MRKKRRLFILALAVLIFLAGYCLIYVKPDNHVEGYPYLVDKNREGNSYYIYVDNDFANHSRTRLECTKQQYDKVVIDPKLQYHIAFEFNSHAPREGKLNTLDFNDTIDNRSVHKFLGEEQ